MVSRQPILPQVQGVRSPATVVWPSEPAVPVAPRWRRWSSTSPATIVLATWTCAKSRTFCPSPNIISASAMPRRPLSTTIGRSIADSSIVRSGTSRQPRSAASRSTPASGSTIPTLPTPRPTRRARSMLGSASRPLTHSARRRIRSAGPRFGWVGRRSRRMISARGPPRQTCASWTPMYAPITMPPSGARSTSTSRRPGPGRPVGSMMPTSRDHAVRDQLRDDVGDGGGGQAGGVTQGAPRDRAVADDGAQNGRAILALEERSVAAENGESHPRGPGG